MTYFPRGPSTWMGAENTAYYSIPFTWNLPKMAAVFQNVDIFIDRIVVGGPAVRLMPHYFDDMPYVHVDLGDIPGVMQRVNPWATKTSAGCVRKCEFCAVPKTEGALVELDDWPDLPIITDNNLLACSVAHFDKVMDRLEKHKGVDFNRGLDARLMTNYHAQRIARLKLAKRGVRLSLDSMTHWDDFLDALWMFDLVGIAKRNVSSYAIIGFDSDPSEAWERCKAIEGRGIRPLPMWFHELDAMKPNQVTKKQEALGWTDYERRRIMQWYYQHKRAAQ